MERAPEGVITLRVNVSSSRSLNVYWTPVSQANGRLRYHVYFHGLFVVQHTSTLQLRSVHVTPIQSYSRA